MDPQSTDKGIGPYVCDFWFFGSTTVRGTSLVRHLLIAAGLLGMPVLAQSCDSGGVPAPPTAGGSSSGSSSGKKLKGDDDDSKSKKKEEDSATSSDTGETFGSSSGEETSSGEASSGTSSGVTVPDSFKRDGAQSVGDDAQKKEVKDCGASGKFYDRFADTPTCGSVELAKVDCTDDGIKAALAASEKLLAQFKEAVSTTYSGMEIDQCVDCPVGTAIGQCKTATPPKAGGTKVLFVKMDGTKIDGKGMMLPIRPFQK